MSDPSDSGSDDVRSGFINGGDHDDICRDFVRNVCRRGTRCKYRHPADQENGQQQQQKQQEMGSSSKPELTFCHDFQNMGCHRPSCKFLHCTRAEEEHFHQTGQLPGRMHSHMGPQSGGNGGGGAHSEIPLCRDYMKGECKRGGKCKYRHINNDYPDCDPRGDMGGGGPPPSRMDSHMPPRHDLRPDMRQGGPPPHPHSNDPRNNHGGYNSLEDSYDKYERYEYIQGPNHGPQHSQDGPSLKRRRVDLDGYVGGGGGSAYEGSRYAPATSSTSRASSYQQQVLEEENTALRRRVEELKKQVSDLTATNEVLLEQNARLRVAKSSAVTQVHAMPVTQTLAHAAGTLNLATMATNPAATLQATHLTQQIALNSDMATQHALQSAAQRMAREMQQHQHVAAAAPQPRPQGAPQPPPAALGTGPPPPGLNSSVTMNPPLASLSMPQNNLVAVSLPSLVTPTMGPPPGASMASMAQNLGPPSNPLVSYPIMSQDMRCAVVPSSLAH